MKGNNFSTAIQRIKYVTIDFIMTSIAFILFDIFRYRVLDAVAVSYSSLTTFLFSDKLIMEQVLIPVGMLCIYWLSGYYNRPLIKSRLTELSTTLLSACLGTIIIFLAILINDTTGVKIKDYEIIIVLWGLLAFFTYLGRSILTAHTNSLFRSRSIKYTTLIIGNSPKSREVYRKLHAASSLVAYDVAGFIRLEGEEQVEDDMPVWDRKDVAKVCREQEVDQIILAPERRVDIDIMNILEELFPLSLPVKIEPDTLSFITGNIAINDILGIPFIDLTSPRISECQKNIKRTFDVAFSILMLLMLSPLLAVIAIIVKCTSPGPVIYRQERIGKGHKPFMIYKFRSMCRNAEADGPQLSSDNDPRITPIGRFMRKYRIDEFPQFWNVIKGDMSMVGPRPEREYFIERIIKRAPYYGLIFQIRPGVTSWGMVKYGYASTVDEMVERSRYDLLYLNNMSISTDIKILLHTIRTVIKGAGV